MTAGTRGTPERGKGLQHHVLLAHDYLGQPHASRTHMPVCSIDSGIRSLRA